MFAYKSTFQITAQSKTITRTPSQSNLLFQKTAVPKIALVLFDWREHALSCKNIFFLFWLRNSSFLKQLKITWPMFSSSPRLQTLHRSPLLSPPCAIFSCPQDPPCSCLSFSLLFPPSLPSVWLGCCPEGCSAPQHHLYSGWSHKGGHGYSRRQIDQWEKPVNSYVEIPNVFARNKQCFLCRDICGNSTSTLWKHQLRCV